MTVTLPLKFFWGDDFLIIAIVQVCPAVQTQCWKNVVDKSGSCSSSYSDGGTVCWQKCSGANSFDCGAFCTNSELNCAKMTLVFIKSGMDTLNSMATLKEKVTPKLLTFANAQAAKTFVTKLMGEAKNFQFSSKLKKFIFFFIQLIKLNQSPLYFLAC